MKIMPYGLGLAAASALAALSAASANATILVDQDLANVYSDWFVGNTNPFGWLDFTDALAAQDGGYVIGSVANAADVAGASAILLVARSNYGPSTSLTAQEATNLTNFLATGGRVAIIGDGVDFVYGDWTSSIVDFASGGTATASYFVSGTANAIPGSDLTDGVTSVLLQGAATANGGTALFAPNWATLWGDNLLTVLDVNALSRFPGPAFRDNVATWLGESKPAVAAVPEPASWALMIAGLAFAGASLRRRARTSVAVAFG